MDSESRDVPRSANRWTALLLGRAAPGVVADVVLDDLAQPVREEPFALVVETLHAEQRVLQTVLGEVIDVDETLHLGAQPHCHHRSHA